MLQRNSPLLCTDVVVAGPASGTLVAEGDTDRGGGGGGLDHTGLVGPPPVFLLVWLWPARWARKWDSSPGF